MGVCCNSSLLGRKGWEDRIINKWLQLSGEVDKNSIFVDAKQKEKYSQIYSMMKFNYLNQISIDLLLVLSYLERDYPTHLDIVKTHIYKMD